MSKTKTPVRGVVVHPYAAPVKVMPLTDLRLQMDYQTRYPVSPKGSLYPVYRFARANGWHCGHWHKSLDEAEECLDSKLAVIRHRQEAGDAGQSSGDRS